MGPGHECFIYLHHFKESSGCFFANFYHKAFVWHLKVVQAGIVVKHEPNQGGMDKILVVRAGIGSVIVIRQECVKVPEVAFKAVWFNQSFGKPYESDVREAGVKVGRNGEDGITKMVLDGPPMTMNQFLISFW